MTGWDQNGSGCEGLEWIQLAQDRVRRRAVVNAVVKTSGSGATELVLSLS
jgi:hypothetical protein